jgi:outer membrane protein assembly factor BamB
VVKLPQDDFTTTNTAVASAIAGFRPATAAGDDNTSPNATFADVIAESPGTERFDFESAFGKPTVNGQWQECVGRCFARDGNGWKLVWQTEPIRELFQPLPLVGDFDGDGSPEVAVLPFHELLLFDARTGRVKDRVRFTDTRSYGFFGVYDFDRDGRSEFLVQADFSKHIDVLGFREGRLQLLWQRNIEPDISNPRKILRVGPAPVADVDGDGRSEVLASVFNDAGDQRWHLTIHDALTGRVMADLPDEVLAGTIDVDGNGTNELLTTHARGAGVPEFGTISIFSWKEGSPRKLWQQDRAGWQFIDVPLPSNVKSTATFGRRTVLSRSMGGRIRLVIRQPRSVSAGAMLQLTLSEVRGSSCDLREVYSVAAPGAEALAIDEQSRLLVRVQHPPGLWARLELHGAAAAIHSTRHIGAGVSPAAVTWTTGDKLPTVLVQGVGEEIVHFQPERGKHESTESDKATLRRQRDGAFPIHRLSGRGQSGNWSGVLHGPVVGDLRGDDHRQLIFATAAPSGGARLVARDLRRQRELWHHDFPNIPGSPPVWNIGGIVFWQTGRFTAARRRDVLVTVRRSMMHSDETLLLDGRDGRELWHRDREVSQRGVGGTPFAVADADGDRLDDVASLYPSILYILEGRSGRDLIARDATWPEVPAKPVYWGQPIAGDFLNSQATAYFFGGRSMSGVFRSDGTLVWWDALDQGPQDFPAFGDFEGDGRMEAIGAGYPDGIRCYDTASGKVKWRLDRPAAEPLTGSASFDSDGDGRDEAIFVFGRHLVAIGTTDGGVRGVLKWELDLPAAVGPPAIASLAPGESASILLVGSDGYVYCVR